jgi:hypothetical protein
MPLPYKALRFHIFSRIVYGGIGYLLEAAAGALSGPVQDVDAFDERLAISLRCFMNKGFQRR